MSFRCQTCREPQPTGVKPVKVVTKTRVAHYRNYIKVGEGRVLKETEGTEIVKERFLCGDCAKPKELVTT